MILSTHGIIGSSGGAIASTLNTNLYAVYKAESNANDSLGVYNGTAVGGLTYSAGKSGNAFTFNGTNAYVQLPNNSLNFLNDFEIGFWINLTGVNLEQCVLSNAQRNSAGSTRFGYMIYINNNVLDFQIYDGTNYTNLTFNIGAYYNGFHYFQFQRDWSVGSAIKINGAVVASNASTMNPAYRSDVVHTPSIGIYKNTEGTSYPMLNGGKIDEVNIWNRILTGAEDTTLYNSGTGKFYPTF